MKTGFTHQIIPVHTSDDNVLYAGSYGTTCFKLNEIRNKTAHSEDYLYYQNSHKDLNTYLQNVTGNANIGGVMDTMFIEKVHNMTWPAWMNEDIFHVLRNVIEPLGWFYGCVANGIPRYKTGRLLEEIISNMKKRKEDLLNSLCSSHLLSSTDILPLVSNSRIHLCQVNVMP